MYISKNTQWCPISKKEELLILSALKVLYSGGRICKTIIIHIFPLPSHHESLNIYFKQMNITRCAKNIKSNQFRNHVKIIKQSKVKNKKIFCSSEYYKQVVFIFHIIMNQFWMQRTLYRNWKVIPFIDLNYNFCESKVSHENILLQRYNIIPKQTTMYGIWQKNTDFKPINKGFIYLFLERWTIEVNTIPVIYETRVVA